MIYVLAGIAIFGMTGWATFGAMALRQYKVRIDLLGKIADQRFDLAAVERVRDDSLDELDRRADMAETYKSEIEGLNAKIADLETLLADIAPDGSGAARWDRMSETVPSDKDD